MDNQDINQNSERKTIIDWVNLVRSNEDNYKLIYQNEECTRWVFDSFNNGVFLDYLFLIKFLPQYSSITFNLNEFKSFLNLTIWMYEINNNKEDIKKIQEADLKHISSEQKTISDWVKWAVADIRHYNFICEGDNKKIQFFGNMWGKKVFLNQDFINNLNLYIEDHYIDNQEFTIKQFLIILKKSVIDYYKKEKAINEDTLQEFLNTIQKNQDEIQEKQDEIQEDQEDQAALSHEDQDKEDQDKENQNKDGPQALSQKNQEDQKKQKKQEKQAALSQENLEDLSKKNPEDLSKKNPEDLSKKNPEDLSKKNLEDLSKKNQDKKELSNVSTNAKIIITLTTLVILAGLSYMVYIFKIEPAIKRKTIKTQFDIKK